jgi:hypothetical protein
MPGVGTTQQGIAGEAHMGVSECRVLKLPVQTVRLPNLEVQEKLQELSHVDLVVSQMPMEVLHDLQIGITQGNMVLSRYYSQ